jgi:hypothetical protein
VLYNLVTKSPQFVRAEVVVAQQEGVIYYPSRYDPPVGHAGFEVRLTAQPGARYFDVCRAAFPMEQAGALRRLVVEHPYRLAGPLRFVAGRIRLDAHDGDHVEVLTFGGEAVFTEEDGQTTGRVTSPAPFLPLDDDPESPYVLIEAELEAVVARLRAGWGNKEYEHLDRLNHVDPMDFFVAALHTLEERLAQLARVEDDEPTRRVLRVVRQIRAHLTRAGEWTSESGLADIL